MYAAPWLNGCSAITSGNGWARRRQGRKAAGGGRSMWGDPRPVGRRPAGAGGVAAGGKGSMVDASDPTGLRDL